jgi:hypothetical protein
MTFGAGYGRQGLVQKMGNPVSVLFNGDNAFWKPGGITIDWATVAVVTGSDVTLEGGQVVPVGNKYLRYGQVMCLITSGGSNKFGPYDSAAGDGRATLSDDTSFILTETVIANGPGGYTTQDTVHLGVIKGGSVWKKRLLATSGTHSLAAGPTYTEIASTFPLLHMVTTDY